MPLVAGSATRDITCALGSDLGGQLHRRFAERVRDPLEANFLYLADGDTAVLLVSLDLAALPEPAVTQHCLEAIAQRTGVPAQQILLSCTHTHTGPDVLALLYDAPRNDAYLAQLPEWLVDGAVEAVAGARPARVGWGRGQAQIGYNRRLCWADGTHSMYGDSSRAEFTGFEGPVDPGQAMFYAVDEQGRIIAIVHNNSCHSTCVEGDSFISADFPGEARRLIREALNAPLPVLYLQGASGDLSPWDMRQPGRYDGERRLREAGSLLAAETLRLLHENQPTPGVTLDSSYAELPVGVRLPTPAELAAAEDAKARGEQAVGRFDYIIKVDGVLRLHELYKDNPVDSLPVHIVRIGDVAIASNPCELYCQFGLDLKRRSPAPITMIAQLTNGLGGYCPTAYGALGGGYSGEAIYWSRLEVLAGYKLVDFSAAMLHELWRAKAWEALG